jgi:hypothetical protein
VKKGNPLKAFVDSLKAEDKAERTPSATLLKIIEDYSASDRFDQFVLTHRASLPDYISDHATSPRPFRASAAGKCQQSQVYNAVKHPETDKIRRPPRQFRALYNGTFSHLRWHLMFDALHADGIVTTLAAEELHINDDLKLSGSIDRLIEFQYLEEPFRTILDFKTIRAQYWKDLIKPQWDHFMSAHAYKMLHFDAKNYMLLYENKDTQELKIYDFAFDEVTERRLSSMYFNMAMWRDQYLCRDPIEVRIKLPLIVRWCRYCPWQKACLEEHPDLHEQQQRIGEEEMDDGEVDIF